MLELQGISAEIRLQRDIADLLRRVSTGDKLAESEVIKQLIRPLNLMLRRRSGDAELAKDLARDTIFILLTRLRSTGLDDPSKLSAFAHRTALNVWIGHIRKEQRRDTHTDSDAIERAVDQSADQLKDLLREEQARAIRELLNEMPNERDRQILRLTYLLQQEKKQVCDRLDLNSAQFDRVIHRAKNRFRAIADTLRSED